MTSGHIHMGVMLGIIIALMLPMVNFTMRTIAGYLHATPLGKALAYLY
jgi:hypothetical protein